MNQIYINIYKTTTSSIKRCIKPATLDRLEKNLGAICALGALGLLCGTTSVISNMVQSKTTLWAATKAVVLSTASMMSFTFSFRAKNFLDSIKKEAIKAKIISIAEHSKKNGRSMLALRASFDTSGALTKHAVLAQYEYFAKTHSIDLIEGTSKQAIKNAMNANHKQYDLLLVDGHANSQRIRLAENYILTKNSTNTLAWIRNHVKPGGSIILDACSTGKGSNNIARAISLACPGVRVYAATDTVSSLDGVEYNEFYDPTFVKTGSFRVPTDALNFDALDKVNITKIYMNGENTILLPYLSPIN